MCGIVGYVGDKPVLDVVIEGLRRLEYRGYDSAGVAVIAADGMASAKRAGKLVNLEKQLDEHPLPPATVGMGHTRWATHGAPTDRNAHPHMDDSGRVAVIHNGIIENFADAADRARGTRAGLPQRHRHGGGRAPARVRRTRRPATWATRCAPCVAGSREPSRWSRCTPTRPTSSSVPGATAPWSSGIGDGENFLGSDVTAFIAHTRERPRARTGPGRGAAPRRVTVTDFDGAPAAGASSTSTGTPPRRRRAATTTSCSRRSPSSRKAVADTLLGRVDSDGRLALDEMRLSDERAARGRQGRHHRVRDGVPRRSAREVCDRALDADPVRGGAGERVPLSRPDPRPGRRWSSRSARAARRWTR